MPLSRFILRFLPWILLITLVIVISLSACQRGAIIRSNPLSSRSGNFDATASITYRDLKATASITRETPRACTVSFTSPKSLMGMSFVFHDGMVDLAYKDISFTFSPESIPGGAAAKIAVLAINRAMKDDGVEVDYTAGVLSLNGVMENGAFTLRLDPEKGNIMTLSVPGEELEIEFMNFTFLD